MSEIQNVKEEAASLLEKSVEMSLLLDFYGEVLSDKQREAMTLYYDEDLSLAEIASITSLTRPGVRDRIVKASLILTDLEDKLHLASRFRAIKDETESLILRLSSLSSASAFDDNELRNTLDALKRISEDI